MAILDYNIQAQIDGLSECAYDKSKRKEFYACLKLHEQAWSMYPEPKNNWNEAYNTAKYAVDDSFKMLDLDNVKKWLNRMIYINNNLHQSDEELAHYIGKYKFEIKDYQGAFEDFKNVVQVAGMREFDNEPSKYMDTIPSCMKWNKETMHLKMSF